MCYRHLSYYEMTMASFIAVGDSLYKIKMMRKYSPEILRILSQWEILHVWRLTLHETVSITLHSTNVQTHNDVTEFAIMYRWMVQRSTEKRNPEGGTGFLKFRCLGIHDIKCIMLWFYPATSLIVYFDGELHLFIITALSIWRPQQSYSETCL